MWNKSTFNPSIRRVIYMKKFATYNLIPLYFFFTLCTPAGENPPKWLGEKKQRVNNCWYLLVWREERNEGGKKTTPKWMIEWMINWLRRHVCMGVWALFFFFRFRFWFLFLLLSCLLFGFFCWVESVFLAIHSLCCLASALFGRVNKKKL